MDNLYIKLEVWERIDEDTVNCYHIFQSTSKTEYVVQSKDSIDISNIENAILFSKAQSFELFADMLPSMRGKSFPSIEQAIAEFNKSFE